MIQDRYPVVVEEGTVYVEADMGRIEIGDVAAILDLVGGPAWTIEYSAWEKEQYPDRDTSDEGLTVDVVDTIEAMTLDEKFVTGLKALPTDEGTEDDESMSPRLGLFVGALMENLEGGVH